MSSPKPGFQFVMKVRLPSCASWLLAPPSLPGTALIDRRMLRDERGQTFFHHNKWFDRQASLQSRAGIDDRIGSSDRFRYYRHSVRDPIAVTSAVMIHTSGPIQPSSPISTLPPSSNDAVLANKPTVHDLDIVSVGTHKGNLDPDFFAQSSFFLGNGEKLVGIVLR